MQKFIPLTAAQKQELNIEIVAKSFSSGRILTSIILVFEMIMIGCALIFYDLSSPRNAAYLSLYFFLFAVCIAGLLVCMNAYRLSFRTKHILLLVFSSVILLWSECITLLDMTRYNNPIVYITVLFGIAGGIFLPPKEAAAIFTGSFCIFFLGLFYIRPEYSLLPLFLNLFVALTIAVCISFLKYSAKVKEFLYKTQLVALVDELKTVSSLDPLTGVKNRVHLQTAFHALLEKQRGSGRPLTLAILDVDNFKSINDTFGHIAGDNCLIRLGSLLTEQIPSDYIYRFGGEEFLILFEESEEAVYNYIETLRQTVEETDFQQIHFTISAGIASCVPERRHTETDFLRTADEALYRSKAKGKNRITTSRIA